MSSASSKHAHTNRTRKVAAAKTRRWLARTKQPRARTRQHSAAHATTASTFTSHTDHVTVKFDGHRENQIEMSPSSLSLPYMTATDDSHTVNWQNNWRKQCDEHAISQNTQRCPQNSTSKQRLQRSAARKEKVPCEGSVRTRKHPAGAGMIQRAESM